MNCEVCEKLKKDLELKLITKDEYFNLIIKHNSEEMEKLNKKEYAKTNQYN